MTRDGRLNNKDKTRPNTTHGIVKDLVSKAYGDRIPEPKYPDSNQRFGRNQQNMLSSEFTDLAFSRVIKNYSKL